MAKTKGGYDLDVNEAGLDDQIRILEKHQKIAEKHKMIAEIVNKTKKLEQEWEIHNFGYPVERGDPYIITFLREQEVKLRTAEHEVQKITHHRDQIVKQYGQHHKELKTEKENLQKEASNLNNLLEKKDKKIQQKDKEISELNDKTVAILEEASMHFGNCFSRLEQREEEMPGLNDLIAVQHLSFSSDISLSRC